VGNETLADGVETVGTTISGVVISPGAEIPEGNKTLAGDGFEIVGVTIPAGKWTALPPGPVIEPSAAMVNVTVSLLLTVKEELSMSVFPVN